MHDPRIDQLARTLVRYSTQVKKGDFVWIDCFDVPNYVAQAMIRAVVEAKAHPLIHIHDTAVTREMMLHAADDQYDLIGAHNLELMKKMDCYIAVRGSNNITENSDVPAEKMKMVMAKLRPLQNERVNNTRWCVLRWPTSAMAQQAGMSTQAFEDFYFKVCCVDYARMAAACEPLAARMRRADRVHIKGPGETDLIFSIKGVGVVPCCGDKNIPDGECFTAPVRDSVNGVLHYNTPTVYNGQSFENVRFVFRNGRIVEASCQGDSAKLNDILDTDEGARFIGEFAIGFNPHITHAMKDILFDEKIAGSFHFTPGRCYEETENGNRSEIHWDLVCIQRADHGGGTIAFDGEIIRKDGIFLAEELKGLNPDQLG